MWEEFKEMPLKDKVEFYYYMKLHYFQTHFPIHL